MPSYDFTATGHHIGAHMPITGGLHMAVERIMDVGGTALQIFTRNQRQWNVPPIEYENVRRFIAARESWGDHPVAAHDSYLVNMANPDPEKRARSQTAFAEELRRCVQLKIPFLITHPGSHMGQGADAGIALYAATLDTALGLARNMDRDQEDPQTTGPLILLETTAGQGTNLGSSFEELAGIISASRHPSRIGVCLDTCHAHAAGYDLTTPDAFDTALAHFDRTIGLEKLRFLHLNDTKHPLGSRKDRHEHIGKGHIGPQAFALLLNDPRTRHLPMTIETPKDKTLAEDRANLAALYGMIGKIGEIGEIGEIGN